MKIETGAEQMLFCTVQIQTKKVSGQPPERTYSGTAFIISYKEDKDKEYLFLVTNKHVIKGAKEGRFKLTKMDNGKPVLGTVETITVDQFESAWFGHPDSKIDIAIMPLVPLLNQLRSSGKECFFKVIPLELIPTKEQIEDLDAVQEIVFVGYPAALYDTSNYLPIIKRGTTATHITNDFSGSPAFLIDSTVFHGSSGSPVFIYDNGVYATRKGNIVGSRLFLCGIIATTYVFKGGTVVPVDIPTTEDEAKEMPPYIGLGLAFKAHLIKDTIIAFLASVALSKKSDQIQP